MELLNDEVKPIKVKAKAEVVKEVPVVNHPNPIIQMAIDQAAYRLAKETAK